ncbi:MAG: D-glycero-beta-D-manno-heptose 1-phosphate adenylyltransferase [Bacteroidetes bacterium]|nr:MAG: D-glycero-beta-D-manno-heptose 1-phosphate adenylyltransferase [Bacteroidota bacterium]
MSDTSAKIVSTQKSIEEVQNWKKSGLKVVFTNGCFDILHLGHVDYLEKASKLGDKLVVGLNTDASVSRIKGPTRPITDQISRSRVMAALAFVDLVVFFDNETPLELISQLIPSVLVKGNDYLAENIVGANIVKQHNGSVKTIELVSGYSTSAVVNKIKTT